MQAKKNVLDTNLLIRFFVDDVREQSELVSKLISNAQPKSLVVPDVVMMEIIYVLQEVYGLSKESLIEKVEAIINFEGVDCNRSLLRESLDCFGRENMSFVDAYLFSLARRKGYKLLSFDKRLQKVDKKIVFSP